MTQIIAIDEAGKGPVIGNLVICGVLIEENNKQKLLDLGVKDSKLLTPKKREELNPEVKKIVKDYKVISVTPKELDQLMKSGINLNRIELLKTAEIINNLKGDKAIIDCPSPNLNAYKRDLQAQLNRKIELIVEHKADLNHPEVSAASIIAKVARDQEIKQLQEQYDADFGSGYMSDPLTKKFIEENWQKYPELFRKSWSSWKDLAFNKNQKRLGEF